MSPPFPPPFLRIVDWADDSANLLLLGGDNYLSFFLATCYYYSLSCFFVLRTDFEILEILAELKKVSFGRKKPALCNVQPHTRSVRPSDDVAGIDKRSVKIARVMMHLFLRTNFFAPHSFTLCYFFAARSGNWARHQFGNMIWTADWHRITNSNITL